MAETEKGEAPQTTMEAPTPKPEEAKTKDQIKSQAVFPEGKPTETQALGQTLAQINIKLEALRKLQKEHPTPERLEQIAKLERQWGLASRFARLQASGTDEQKQIIEKKETPEQLKASDVLFLKKKWVDLANLLLVPAWGDGTKSTNSELIKEGKDKSFIVNFWENRNVDNVIGAGDILPTTVKHVKINGVDGERKNVPRPGYYDMKSGKYLPIHDGDKIEITFIIKAGDETEAERKAAGIAEDAWFTKNRINDLASEEGDIDAKLPEDKEILEEVKQEKERRKKFIEQFGSASAGQDTIEFSKFRIEEGDFKEIASLLGLPESKIPVVQSMMASIGKQESWSNYASFWVELNSGTHRWDRALGRYQIMPKNWLAWSNKFFWKTLEYTPENQDKVAFAQMTEYYMRHERENSNLSYIISEVSGDWYGRGTAPAGFPSTQQYAQSVIGIYNAHYKNKDILG